MQGGPKRGCAVVDELKSARAKLARARTVFAEFDQIAAPWRKARSYKRVITVEPATGEEVHKLVRITSIPEQLEQIAADVVGNLRAALDQAAYAVATAATSSGKFAQFPIAETFDDVEQMNLPKGKSRAIPAGIFQVMTSFKPYRGGNNLLWALHELSNCDKHRITREIKRSNNSRRLDLFVEDGSVRRGMTVPQPPLIWGSDQEELEILRIKTWGAARYRSSIAVALTFGDLDDLSWMPVEAVLTELAALVEQILDAIEAQAVRESLFTSAAA